MNRQEMIGFLPDISEGVERISKGEKTIKSMKVRGLLTKLMETFIGGIDDSQATISLVQNGESYNVSIEHPVLCIGNGKMYLFPEGVSLREAKDKYGEYT